MDRWAGVRGGAGNGSVDVSTQIDLLKNAAAKTF